MDRLALSGVSETGWGSGRASPLAIDEAAFRALGHALVDRIAGWQATLAQRPVTRNETPAELRVVLGAGALPASGTGAQALLDDAVRLLLDHAAPCHHPRHHGYVSAAPAPIAVLAELLAAALNANVALWHAAPLAAEIEAQTVRWLAELVGYHDAGSAVPQGLLTSGGTQANAMALQLALAERIEGWREHGLRGRRLAVYASDQTHGWLAQAAEQAGLGRSAVRWIASDANQRIDVAALQARIDTDRADGVQALMVVGTAGTVGTGAVDPLATLAALCRGQGLWWHVDGAYGAAAACCLAADGSAAAQAAQTELLGDAAVDLRSLREADSLALDPHKWLSVPIEAGCLLTRAPHRLADAYGDQPSYYGASRPDEGPSFHCLGPQNTRGFRALKVWLALRMAGRDGYRQLIGDDIALARRLFDRVRATPRLQACTQRLSIVTLRYRPAGWADGPALDALNRELLSCLQRGGRAHLSQAVVNGRFALRACIVNFRTEAADIDALPGLVVEIGDALSR